MARRSDHSPEALRDLLVTCGHALMGERGFVGFSAREAARRAGYSVGTIYNVFGSLDAYLAAINTRTFLDWAMWVKMALGGCSEPRERIRALVRAYFTFAEQHSNNWMAIYDHRPNEKLDETEAGHRAMLIETVDREVAAALGREVDDELRHLVRSLVATVHGHCVLHIGGSYALMDAADPLGQATARVVEILDSHGEISG